jgi:hypothetical protein
VAIDGYVNFKDGSPKILAEAVYPLAEQSEILAFKPRPKKNNSYGNWKNGKSNGNGSKEVYLNKMENRLVSNLDDSGSESPDDFKMSGSRSALPHQDYKSQIKKLVITIPPGSDKSILLELKAILVDAPGLSSITLKIPNNGSGFKEAKIKNQALISPVLIKKLNEVVGKENIIIL